MIYGGIEAGGTKWVCAIGEGDGRVSAITTVPTTTPSETISRAMEFFVEYGRPDAIGVGAFGPIDPRPASATYGQITTTPKPGWANTDIVSRLGEGLGVPLAFDTDVNAAAVGEWRWGAAVGLDTFCYITVGTGIGGGAVVNGRVLHGLLHPEFGHMRIPHDRNRDPFEGVCPYHGDCFEGLASGEAIRRRWGSPAQDLRDVPAVWELEAEYLALGIVNVVHTLAPQRIILGGGVVKQPGVLALLRARFLELVGGYLDIPALAEPSGIDNYIVTPLLADRSGVLGAIELARRAAELAGKPGLASTTPAQSAAVTDRDSALESPAARTLWIGSSQKRGAANRAEDGRE